MKHCTGNKRIWLVCPLELSDVPKFTGEKCSSLQSLKFKSIFSFLVTGEKKKFDTVVFHWWRSSKNFPGALDNPKM